MRALNSLSDINVRTKSVLLVLLAALTLAFCLFLNPPGHVTIDETVYHLMARSFSMSGGLEILNGYQEFPSPAFDSVITHAIGDRLVSPYPYLYPLLTYPFYWLAGYHGLFVFNALAFIGAAWFCAATAQKLFGDLRLSLTAALLFVLATYAWEYSQASWPHATATLIVSGAAYLVASAMTLRDGRRSLALAAAAGLTIGFGVGVRIDVFFAMPALLLPFLFSSPVRPWPALAAAMATVPGLAVLAATNYAKFGTAMPFSYGPSPAGEATSATSYLVLFCVGVSAVAVLWILTRPRMQFLLARRPWPAVIALVMAVGLLALIPEFRAFLVRLVNGAYFLFVDLRVRDLIGGDVAVIERPGGRIAFMGALKKSLLQSCPYLVMLVLPLCAMVRQPDQRARLAFLLLVPIAFVCVYSYFAWHGGLSLNLRYFVPILPFTSILVAYAWREVLQGASGADRAILVGVGLSAVGILSIVVFAPLHSLEMAKIDLVLRTFPLLLAVALTGVLLLWLFVRGALHAIVTKSAIALLVVAFAWSGVVAFAYDFPRSWAKRSVSVNVSHQTAQLIAPDSIVLVGLATPFSGLYEYDRVRVARVRSNDLENWRPLVDFHLDSGRPVYAWFKPETWNDLRLTGALEALAVVPIGDVAGQSFVQVVRQSAATPVGQVRR